MKKFVIIVFLILLWPCYSAGDTSVLKLRSSHHLDFIRIVIEGEEAIIENANVYQRGTDVLVKFSTSDFSIKAEKKVIDYRRTDKKNVTFSPGEFRGLKVFTLRHPTRLVIDVHLKVKQNAFLPLVIPKENKKTDLRKSKTVVIDPGHGGYEEGVRKGNDIEKNVVLDIARKLETLINRGASSSDLTRRSDSYMSQEDRVKYASDKKADVFISIHVGNHSGMILYVPVVSGQVSEIVKPYLENSGQEKHLNESAELVSAIKEAMLADFGEDMVSVRPLPYGILSKIESAALIIELPSFEDAYYVEELKAEIANTIYQGFFNYEEDDKS
jgi:N-acetylmuramoyl-L-alanine amidase